jgi:hypothetical protein
MTAARRAMIPKNVDVIEGTTITRVASEAFLPDAPFTGAVLLVHKKNDHKVMHILRRMGKRHTMVFKVFILDDSQQDEDTVLPVNILPRQTPATKLAATEVCLVPVKDNVPQGPVSIVSIDAKADSWDARLLLAHLR